jgi:hypothetical protein
MNSHRQFFLITALAMLVFAAIATAPVYHRSVRTVQAAPPAPAVVVLVCATDLSAFQAPYVYEVESSDPALTLPAAATPCAAALQDFFAEGFSRLDSGSTGNAFNDSDLPMPNAVGVYQWTLVRGEGSWQAK